MAGDGLKAGFPSGTAVLDGKNVGVVGYKELSGDAMLMQSQIINVALMKMSYHGPVIIYAFGDTNGIPSSVPQFLSSTRIGLNHVPDGRDDLVVLRKRVMYVLSFPCFHPRISKSVCGNSDLDIQLSKHMFPEMDQISWSYGF